MTITILGINDAIHNCDCCGKSNLKSTVIVDVDGSIFHYGSSCATKNTGLTSKIINKRLTKIKRDAANEIQKLYDVRLKIANVRVRDDITTCNKNIKFREARAKGLVGVPFREYTKETSTKWDDFVKLVAATLDVNPNDIIY